jgi:hypothetical protein
MSSERQLNVGRTSVVVLVVGFVTTQNECNQVADSGKRIYVWRTGRSGREEAGREKRGGCVGRAEF